MALSKLSRVHSPVETADVAKLLLLNKRLDSHVEYAGAPT